MKARRLSEQEARLWEQFTLHDQRLPQARLQRFETDAKPEKAASKAAADPAVLRWLAELVGQGVQPRLAASERGKAEIHLGDGSQLDANTLTRLRRGKMAIDATVDLHGMGEQAARERLVAFVMLSHNQGMRVVRVITGHGIRREGSGVLRASLPRWLNLPEMQPRIVTALEALPEQGGQGAFILLLRRVRA